MEVQELRIGNYVMSKHGIITQIERGDFEYHSGLANLEDNLPIPLTEEWLLKFGFHKDGEYYSKGTKHYHLPSNGFYSGNDHVSGGNVDARIKYVHQLQNLYFALNGKELELK